MNRVLMAACHYPPSGAVAAQRPGKFATYLPEFGWEPLVVARRPHPHQPLDPSLAGHPSACERLNPLEPSMLLGVLPGAWIEPLRRFLCVPDKEMGWMLTLAARLPGLIRRHRPSILWVNSVPVGSLVAGAWVARKMRVPLFVDFHNEWTRNMYYRPATRLHDRAHRALEDFVLRQAAAVTTLNPMHTADLRERYPGVWCETIENGFDPDDYPVAPAEPRRPLVFTYAGAVYGHQSPVPFLKALAQTGRKDVEVRVVGDRFGQFVAQSWPFPVSACGHVLHRDLGTVFSETSAFFLCLEPPAARQLPAKLYEYMHTGRPTFAIVPRDGAADRWIRETGAGVSVASEDPGAWAPALDAFIEAIPRYRPPDAGAYERRALTARLAAMLDKVASSARPLSTAP